MGRTVECGACDARFKVDDAVIVRGKKFYPGERPNSDLYQFQRVSDKRQQKFQPAKSSIIYGAAPDPAVIEPTSPQRILAGIAAVVIALIVGLMLMLGTGDGMVLDGMPTSRRLVMAGFVGFLALVALVYANPKARFKGLLAGTVIAGGLLSLPFLFTANSTQRDHQVKTQGNAPSEEPKPVEESGNQEELKRLIGMGPLEAERERLATSGKQALGIWLKGLRSEQQFLIQDYLLRASGATKDSHLYPRDRGSFLFVISGGSKTLEELSEVVKVFGTPTRIHKELGVLEVQINSDSFSEVSLDLLTNRDHPQFYMLNAKELGNIDLKRVRKAVQRLSTAKPEILRVDITRNLIKLLEESSLDFKDEVCRALMVWSDSPGPAGNAALVVAKKLLTENKPIPRDVIQLIVKEKNADVIPILNRLWLEKPGEWEGLYSELGLSAEESILKSMPETQGIGRLSAIRILGRVGREKSLAAMAKAREGANANENELRVVIEQASGSIQARLR